MLTREQWRELPAEQQQMFKMHCPELMAEEAEARGDRAQAAGWRFMGEFPFGREINWGEVAIFLLRNAEDIQEGIQSFLSYTGTNNIRGGVAMLLWQMGYIDNTPDNKATMSWVMESFHHGISANEETIITIMDDMGPFLDEEGEEKFKHFQEAEAVMLYRGYDGVVGKKFGICWTTDRDTAALFARGVQGAKHTKPMIACGWICPSIIGACFYGREDQVWLADPTQVNIVWDKPLEDAP